MYHQTELTPVISQIIAVNQDIQNETLRASNSESKETIRAMSAESTLMLIQMNMQNASAAADAAMSAALAKFELSTLAALNNLSLQLQETKLELAQARVLLASFQASSSSNNGACLGNTSSLATAVFPDCPRGFSPSASSTPTCPGSNQNFPTTFSCQRKLFLSSIVFFSFSVTWIYRFHHAHGSYLLFLVPPAVNRMSCCFKLQLCYNNLLLVTVLFYDAFFPHAF